jgi:hypothetical protein
VPKADLVLICHGGWASPGQDRVGAARSSRDGGTRPETEVSTMAKKKDKKGDKKKKKK